ncbi:hypothetical protein VDGE_30418 [Verticillium dahliae]|uniref:Uncharacterized protein n=1 Tax=Verticillium dahliae TaxID=27337 RepID=A0A444S745_VERDA|nr:hypothetical protein VDGE_30418 [Verticillium dahliae]
MNELRASICAEPPSLLACIACIPLRSEDRQAKYSDIPRQRLGPRCLTSGSYPGRTRGTVFVPLLHPYLPTVD